jgi:hypothetical protein
MSEGNGEGEEEKKKQCIPGQGGKENSLLLPLPLNTTKELDLIICIPSFLSASSLFLSLSLFLLP